MRSSLLVPPAQGLAALLSVGNRCSVLVCPRPVKQFGHQFAHNLDAIDVQLALPC